jgi:hypothetical protein
MRDEVALRVAAEVARRTARSPDHIAGARGLVGTMRAQGVVASLVEHWFGRNTSNASKSSSCVRRRFEWPVVIARMARRK